MPQSVNKIIHYQDAGKTYNRLEFNSEKQVSVKYIAGDFGSLVPKEMPLNYKIKKTYDEPLFNKSNNGIINESINGPTIIYLELRKDIAIKELYGPTSNITYDLFYGQEGLIYSFYSDLLDTISFKIKVDEDVNKVYQKIKTNPEDIFYRHHFINRALANANKTFAEVDSENYPELMTKAQTAALLQTDLKTFSNWVSDGKIQFTVIGKKRYFKKSEILNANQSTSKKR